MAENPYDPPSRDSSTLQSAFVKASKIKACPKCGKDVGVWLFMRMGFKVPPSLRCNSCGTRLHLGSKQTQAILAGSQFIGGMAFVLAVTRLWFTESWEVALSFAVTMFVFTGLLFAAFAPLIRRHADLRQ